MLVVVDFGEVVRSDVVDVPSCEEENFLLLDCMAERCVVEKPVHPRVVWRMVVSHTCRQRRVVADSQKFQMAVVPDVAFLDGDSCGLVLRLETYGCPDSVVLFLQVQTVVSSPEVHRVDKVHLLAHSF